MRDDMDRQEYIIYALSQIDDDTVWWEIEKELSAHIDDREQYYLDCGYDSETAARKAMEHMGSPEAAADGFSKVHKNYRRITAIIATAFYSIFLVFVWLMRMSSYRDPDVYSGFVSAESLGLLYIIGLSVLGKRRNSRFICFAAVVNFILMYGLYLWSSIIFDDFDTVFSTIVLKLICLLTGDLECCGLIGEVYLSSVSPYISYLSIAFYAAIFIMLVLVFISVCMIKKPSYSLKEKHFARQMFKIQKRVWIFIALTSLILSFIGLGNFDKDAGTTVKTGYFNTVLVAQSDTPCPISEIPTEDIFISCCYTYDFNTHIFVLFDDPLPKESPKNISVKHGGTWITKSYKNKLEYRISEEHLNCAVTKKYVYIDFLHTDRDDTNLINSVYQIALNKSENWYEVESIDEISTGVDANNQVKIIIEKSP